jgi:hypothetical protein
LEEIQRLTDEHKDMLEAIIIEFEAELEQNHRVVEDEFVVIDEKI